MAEFINTVDVIGDDALTDSIICRTVTEYKDDSITVIGDKAFVECSNLEVVDTPLLNNIKYLAFDKCSILAVLILRNNGVCTLGSDVFRNTPIKSGTGYIYVPSALVDSYKSATNWSAFGDQIRAIEDYPDICGG